MQIRNHVRTLALGTALALSVAGMPAAHAFAAAPGHITQPHPIVMGSAAPMEVHSTGEPGQPDEQQCEQKGQDIQQDLTHIKWAASTGSADKIADAWAVYSMDVDYTTSHCLVID